MHQSTKSSHPHSWQTHTITFTMFTICAILYCNLSIFSLQLLRIDKNERITHTPYFISYLQWWLGDIFLYIILTSFAPFHLSQHPLTNNLFSFKLQYYEVSPRWLRLEDLGNMIRTLKEKKNKARKRVHILFVSLAISYIRNMALPLPLVTVCACAQKCTARRVNEGGVQKWHKKKIEENTLQRCKKMTKTGVEKQRENVCIINWRIINFPIDMSQENVRFIRYIEIQCIKYSISIYTFEYIMR